MQTISELVKLVIAGEVKVPQSLSHYVEDRAQLLDQVFTILSETDIRGMLPDILKVRKLFFLFLCELVLGVIWCVCVCVCVCIDCTRKWIGNAVHNFSSSSVRSRDKIARVRRAPLPGGPGFQL